MHQGSLSIQYQIYQKGYELQDLQLKLLLSAEDAASLAYAPYSKFLVGASIQLADGNIIAGCNQENASYPCGICAERAVLFSYGCLKQKYKITRMAIAVLNNHDINQIPPAPCGLCRQVMSEFEMLNQNQIELILGHRDKVTYVFSSLQTLLPFHFHSGFLV